MSKLTKLPTEIIVDISSQLSFADKLNLPCACKQLHKALSENTLYNKLVFQDKQKFYQAMDLYGVKNFGQKVRHLRVDMNYDLQLLSIRPTRFPGVRLLELEVGCMEFGDQLAETDRATFADMAKDWKNLESIVDSTDMKNVTLRMLERKIFDYLTSLELSFIYARIPSTSKRLKRTQALVQAIHNAPSLQTLKFNDAALKILDVESIHSKATMLKHLEVKLVDLYHNDVADENLSIYQSAKSLEVFCLKWIRAAETDEILDGAIKHWPSYIGIKYPKLKKLFLTKGLSRNREDIIEEQESVARSLAGAFTDMQHLDGYSTNLYSILQSPIFDVIIANHVQLKHFGFLIDNDTSIEKYLQVSKQLINQCQQYHYLNSFVKLK